MKTVIFGLAAFGLVAVLGLLWAQGARPFEQALPAPGVTQPEGALPIVQARPVRILLLGTSLSARGSWSATLEARLAACRSGAVAVEVLARPGHSIRWGRPALQRRLAQGPRPDLIIAEFSINDATLLRGLSLARARAETQGLIADVGEAGIPLYLATMSPAFGWNWFERPGHRRYTALYRELAADHGTGLIDTEARWHALDSSARARALPDGLHPTDAAMQAITVPAFAAALAPLISPGCADPS